jgi:peptidylprolyl isomerase
MNGMKLNYARLLPATRAAAGVLLVSVLGTAAAQTPASAGMGPVVARLGNATIGQGEIVSMLQSMPEQERAAAKSNRTGMENWLRQRLASEALLNEAQSKGWANRPEIKAQIDAAVRQVTSNIVANSYIDSVVQIPAGYPSDQDVQAAYDQGKANFAIPALYHVAQIFISAPRGDAAAVAKARATAQTVASQARTGDFAALARAQSQEPRSAQNGGDVGTLPLAQMVPEVRDAVGKLKPGQVGDPVQSDSGFHIVKLLDSQPARTATLDEVKPRLQAALRQQRKQQLVQEYMANLAKPGAISIDSAALDAALQKSN